MHHIQDIILTIGSLIFIVALIPTIRGHHKPPLTTSITTATVLFTFAAVYVSLHLWFSATTTFGTGISWTVLAIQKYRQH